MSSAAGDVAVRPARREDIGRLWEMLIGLAEYERLRAHVRGSAEQLAGLLFGGEDHLKCLVAERGGVLVGYALFYVTYSSFQTRRGMWLEDLYVDPTLRGSGAGRALMAAVARDAVARGCHGMAWYVLDWNEPAIGFYRRLGATQPASDWLQYSVDAEGLRRIAGE